MIAISPSSAIQSRDNILDLKKLGQVAVGINSIERAEGGYYIALECLLGPADQRDFNAFTTLNQLCQCKNYNEKNLISVLKKFAYKGPSTALWLVEKHFGKIEKIDRSWYDVILETLLPCADHGNLDALQRLELLWDERRSDQLLVESLTTFAENGSFTALRAQVTGEIKPNKAFSEHDLVCLGINSIEKGNYEVALTCLLEPAEKGCQIAMKVLNDLCAYESNQNIKLMNNIKEFAYKAPLTAFSLLEKYCGNVDESCYDAVFDILLPCADFGNGDAQLKLDLLCKARHHPASLDASLKKFVDEGSFTAYRIALMMREEATIS